MSFVALSFGHRPFGVLQCIASRLSEPFLLARQNDAISSPRGFTPLNAGDLVLTSFPARSAGFRSRHRDFFIGGLVAADVRPSHQGRVYP